MEAVQRILDGSQYMTVYKATRPEAQTAAKIAVALFAQRQADSDHWSYPVEQTKTNNGSAAYPVIPPHPQ